MTNAKALEDLAEVYYEAAALQTQLIGQNREKLRQCRTTRNVREELRLKALLCLLYQQKRELLETAAHLKHYYRRPLTAGTGALA